MKDWIVYENQAGKLEAVENEHSWEQIGDIQKIPGNKIVGWPASKTAKDAIDYMEQVLP